MLLSLADAALLLYSACFFLETGEKSMYERRPTQDPRTWRRYSGSPQPETPSPANTFHFRAAPATTYSYNAGNVQHGPEIIQNSLFNLICCDAVPGVTAHLVLESAREES